jgi:hypothetical protein
MKGWSCRAANYLEELHTLKELVILSAEQVQTGWILRCEGCCPSALCGHKL